MTPDRTEFGHPEGGHVSALQWKTASKSVTPRPLLLFSHATGFHAATYVPLLEKLAPHMDIVAADARGHGLTTLAARPEALRGWGRYYKDLEFLLDQQDRPAILAGHSIGGLCSLAVAASRPNRVRGVIAMDPVMLDPTQGLPFRMLQLIGRSDRFPLAAGAKRRRAQFASRDEAYENYRQKRSFSTWPDTWLRAYVDSAFAEQTEGGVRLRCDPAWESRTFAVGECWPWRFVPDIQAPVSLLLPQRDSTCSLRSRRKAARLQPAWHMHEIEGSTHFLPMEKTGDIAHHIIEFAQNCKNS